MALYAPTLSAVSRSAPYRRQQGYDELDENASLLRELTGATLAGVARVGNVLDLPGSTVRDVLAGENPLDQWAPWNWTTSEGRTSGRDLLENWGVLSRNTPGLDWGDVAGFGAEVVADPFFWWTGPSRALTSAGRVAENAGLIGRFAQSVGREVGPRALRIGNTLDDVLTRLGPEATDAATRAAEGLGVSLDSIRGQRLGGMAAFGPPMAEPWAVLGASDAALPAAKALDAIGAAVRWSPPVRAAYQMFGGGSLGTGTRVGQETANAAVAARNAALATSKLHLSEMATDLQRSGVLDPDPFEAGNQLYRWIEGHEQAPAEIADMIDRARAMNADILDAAQEWGVKREMLVDPNIPFYTPRYKAGTGTSRPSKPFSVADESGLSREDILRSGQHGGITGGTETLRRMAKEAGDLLETQSVTGVPITADDVAQWIGNRWGHMVTDEYSRWLPTQGVYESAAGRWKRLAKTFVDEFDSDPDVLKSGFYTDPLTSLQRYTERSLDVTETARAVLHTLADDGAIDLARRAAPGGPEVPVGELLQGLKFDLTDPLSSFAKGGERDRFLQEATGVFGDQVDAAVRIMEARAKTWAGETGRAADEWFSGKTVQRSDPAQVPASALTQPQIPGAAMLKLMSLIEPGAERGALVGMRELRKAAGLPKQEFDELMMQLSREGKVSLHGHDYVATMSKAEVDELVFRPHDPASPFPPRGGTGDHPKGDYYVGAAIRQNTLQQAGRGAVEFQANQTIIHAFQKADISTLAHESAHIFRRDLPQDLLQQAEQALGVTGGNWTRDAEEAFAGGFERYLRDGRAPNQSLLKVFKTFQTWLTNIYRSIVGTPLEQSVSPELRQVFDQMLAAGPDVVPRRGALNKLAELRGPGTTANDVAGLTVPQSLADDLSRMTTAFSGPEPTSQVMKVVDSITGLTKAGQTSLWPAFHVRNLFSGQFRNWVAGMFSPRSVNDTYTLVRGGVVRGASEIPVIRKTLVDRGAQVTDEAATDVLREFAYAYRMTGRGQGEALVGTAAQQTTDATIGGILNQLPGGLGGTRPFKFSDVGKQWIAQAPDTQFRRPWEVRGFGERTATTFGPAKAGESVAELTEDLNRIAPFIEQLRRGIDPAKAAEKVLGAQVDYSGRNFSKFEQQIAQRLFPYWRFNCVPSDHEILTRDGWKRHESLVVGEEVLGYDVDSGELMWTPLRAVNVHDFDGDMVSLETRNSRFEFTENHRWPVAWSSGDAKWTRRDGTVVVRSRAMKVRMVFGSLLRSGHAIPNCGEFNGTESVLSPRHAAILGWVVTDGSFRWRQRKSTHTPHCEMVVYQSPKKFLDEVVLLLGTKPRKPNLQGVHAVPVARDDIVAITNVFRSKSDLSRIVGRLSREAAESMWDAMMKAEGSTVPETGQQKFDQCPQHNPEVLNAFQMLTMLVGRSTNVSKAGNRCYIKKTKWYWIKSNNRIGRFRYHGKVWCPTTDTGTWVMRHNGSVIVTGNSRQIPYVAKELFERPGGLMGQTIRAINEGREEDRPLPEHIAGTAAVPVGIQPDGTRRYITGLGLMEESALNLADRPQSALLGAASQLNPLIRAPLEWMTGESFYQEGPGGGRALEDLDPLIGRAARNIQQSLAGETGYAEPYRLPQFVEFAVSNSPASRFLSSLRTAADPRKEVWARAVNLGTGFRLSDVSPGSQDAVIREALAERIKQLGGRDYVKSYFPGGVQSQEQAEAQLLLDILQDRQRERSRARSQERYDVMRGSAAGVR